MLKKIIFLFFLVLPVICLSQPAFSPKPRETINNITISDSSGIILISDSLDKFPRQPVVKISDSTFRYITPKKLTDSLNLFPRQDLLKISDSTIYVTYQKLSDSLNVFPRQDYITHQKLSDSLDVFPRQDLLKLSDSTIYITYQKLSDSLNVFPRQIDSSLFAEKFTWLRGVKSISPIRNGDTITNPNSNNFSTIKLFNSFYGNGMLSTTDSSGAITFEIDSIGNSKVSGNLDVTLINNIRSYKALLTQTGSNNPSAIVLENSIGDIVWTRSDTGIYLGTLAGAFTTDKTWCPSGIIGPTSMFTVTLTSSSILTVSSRSIGGAVNDGLLSTTAIEIRVYP